MSMKRVTACMLTLFLCLQSPLTILSAELNVGQVKTRTYGNARLGATPNDAVPKEEDQGNSDLSSGLKGKGQEKDDEETQYRGAVQVEIRSVLKTERSNDFTVRLQRVKDKEEIYEAADVVSLDPLADTEDIQTARTAVFSDLQSGKYQLEVSSPGYETYVQTVEVKQDTSRVTLMNDYLSMYSYESGKAHPGILKLGDVNEDEVIDEDDLDALLEAIRDEEAGEAPGGYSSYDLNEDGSVDLVDLQYFTIFYKNTQDSQSKITRYATILPDDYKVATSSNAEKGEVKNLFDGNQETLLSLGRDDSQPVDGRHPLELTLEFDKAVTAGGITLTQPKDTENPILSGEVEIEGTRNGAVFKETIVIQEDNGEQETYQLYGGFRAAAMAAREADGTIVINLNGQTAIKKITIKVTKTSGTNLADISKVEFVNDMKDRIPAPVMNIPKDLEIIPDNKRFTVTWKKEANVTGYQVAISLNGKTDVINTTENRLEVRSFNGEKLKNGTTYTVKVQSVNGDWKSGYCKAVFATPVTDQKPDPPESVVVTGSYKSLKLTWKDMEDTDTYSVFYRVYGSKDEYEAVTGISENKTVLQNLGDKTAYEIYLTGTNKNGESSPSQTYKGETTSYDPPVTPDYKLINVRQELGEPGFNIENVSGFGTDKAAPFAMVDHDFATSWVRNDWDAGVTYPADGIGKSPVITFVEPVEMDTIVLIPDGQQAFQYTAASVYYWPEESTKPVKVSGTFLKRTSSNKKIYYEFQSKEPFSPKKLQVNVQNGYGAANRISIAELKFYYYDSLETQVYNLYEDDLHMALKENVTADIIDDLVKQLNTPDDVSGETHPKFDILSRELENAKLLLNDQAAKGILRIHNDVTKAADGSITFKSGLNAWQPLGVTAGAGENLVIYVGCPGKKTGDSTNLNLIATQYHAESSAWSSTVVKGLKAGANEVTIPAITSLDTEQGGQLYVEYTGAKGRENYSVRVSGGSSIPMLDMTTATDSEAKRALVQDYVKELEEYVPKIRELHDEKHRDELDVPVSYEQHNCILGATDIVMKDMMYSVSAEQILNGLNSKHGSTEEKAEQLYQSLKAMENMVSLFYQHKGLSNAAEAGDKNRLPSSRLNIRYHRMFAGAFMYAGGAHIGIGWGSVPGLTTSSPVVSTEEGLYESGRYFGWGIAHEIGHIVNEGAYAVAEITNNYYSVLAQAKDKNDSVRFQYSDVYDKVTSQVKGPASSVFTQLGMYWQLHLSYDRGGYNYKTYDTYKEQFDNLFFARMDSYVRDPSKAPAPGGVAFTATKNTDNELMRLACAAAQKDILEFFRRWGMTPDEATIRYASQFEKEPRAIWFVNDEARKYAMENGEGGSVAADTTVTADISYTEGTNQVQISLSNDADPKDAMLGYEIYRVERQKDQIIKKPVGFVTADSNSYTDVITTVNNRAFTYQVIGYDKYLNPTKAAETGPVKVSHRGNMDKSKWTVTTNMVSDSDTQGGTDDYYESGNTNPCEPVKAAVEQVIDGKGDTVFTGKAGSELPYVIINLNQEEEVTGFVCTNGGGTPVKGYEIAVSTNGAIWETVKTGIFDWSSGPTQTVYFNKADDWLYTYDASYVKLTAKGQKGVSLSIAELDILGQTGDNVEFFKNNAVGILNQDYDAGIGEDGNAVVIPKGSVVFTGAYKGNPAYSTVLLFDDSGTIVGGSDKEENILASQLIFASVPDHGELGETSDGTWVYYIEPEHITADLLSLKKVRAELYRTDNAKNNRGERLVSDTVFLQMPENLPEITISGMANYINR